MIYLFENPDNSASTVYDETTLTPELKEKGIAIQTLPEPEVQAGKNAVLKCKKATEEVWYDYIDIPPDPVEAVDLLRADFNNAIMELSMAIAMSGGTV